MEELVPKEMALTSVTVPLDGKASVVKVGARSAIL